MTDIFELSDRAVEEVADADPVMATIAGVAGRDHRWPDHSPDGHAERHALTVRLHAEAGAIDVADEANASLAQQVLLDDLGDQLVRFDAGDHLRDLNSIESTFQTVKMAIDMMPKETRDDWGRLVVRLASIDQPLAGYRQTLAAGLDAGDAVAARQVRAVVEEGRIAAGDTSGFVGLLDAYDQTDLDDDGFRQRLSEAVDHARGAYADLAGWLEDAYLPGARQADGVGEDRYLVEARKHLGTTIDPHETYAWGWAELDRLWTRLGEVCALIDVDQPIAGVLDLLHHDPERGAATAEAFIEIMTERQHTALEQLAGTHFDVPDEIRAIDVKVAPAGGALAPYYTPPSEDFSRPGAVWYPLGSKSFFPLFEEVTTAHHEGFPGHHLQVGTQMALGDQLSRYHRLWVWQPGSGEGWALYAEHLMGELGYLDRPEYEVGLLAAQLMRACRVVIDIGMHLDLPIPADAAFHPGERWSYELAVTMLCERAFASDEFARSEITRYLGWPGQAISYKVGEKVILDLREQLRQRGETDLRTFHRKVLAVGSIGLDLLQEKVLA